MAELALYLFGLLLLAPMAYWLWAGAGRKRPVLGRGIALLALAVAGYLLWAIIGMLT